MAPMGGRNAGSKKFQKSYFEVVGLCCSSEVPLIESILKPLEGIKEVSVIVPSRTVIVFHDTLLISQLQIVKALNQARLEANIRAYGDNKYQKKWPNPYAIASGVLLLLSFLKYIYTPLKWLALGAVAAGIFPILLKAISAVRTLRIDINILMMVAVIGTIVMGDYEEAGTIVFLFTVAEWLESMASHKASAAMSSLMNLAPQKAVIAETGEVVDADEVKVNTILAVKAGEVIPIDGIVVDGSCEVDEKALTGESFPVPKQKESTVLAGTINMNGHVCVKTTALAEDCVVAKMAKLVEEAQNSKTRTQRFIDKCAKYYTPAVILVSVLVAVIPTALRVRNLQFWFHLALVVLVSACPCALILSTPVATFCALTSAATYGLLVKGCDCLETLAKVKILAFDKTGTITRGEFVVTGFQSLCHDIDLKTLVYWVSSIESKSSHPMAASIVDYGRSLSVEPHPEKVNDFQNFPGEGICGKLDGKDIYVGNRKIAVRAGSETEPTLQVDTKQGKTIGYIYSSANLIGIFTLSDSCRSGAAETIKELKSMGVKSAMLTGDSHAAAMHAQEQLGLALEVIHAELLPEDKVKFINGFKKEGPTGMVGDGINDAPALAAADIGISMGVSGSALASETGNIILMSNDLRKIPKAILLARRAQRKVIENIFLSITTKAVILGFAFAGHPLVWAAVLADVGTCLLVIGNSMLLLHRKRRQGGKCCKSSTVPHLHKNGCYDSHSKSTHNHHNHQHFCPGDATQEISHSHPHNCSSQKCASKCHSTLSSSVGENTKSDCSDKSHYQSKDNAGSYESEHCYHESSESGKEKIRLHDTCKTDIKLSAKCCQSSSCKTVTCYGASPYADTCKWHTTCDRDKEFSEARCYLSRSCSSVTRDRASQGSSSCFKNNLEGNKESSNSCCHASQNYENNDEESGKTLGTNCCHQEHNLESHFDTKEHKKDHSSIEIMLDYKHDESTSVHTCVVSSEKEEHGSCCMDSLDKCQDSQVLHVCTSLENREIGGCCKSYMKECCSKDRHLGPGFGGGLSEIVIE